MRKVRGPTVNPMCPRGLSLTFIQEAIATAIDDCIIWPYGKSGATLRGTHHRAFVTMNGKRIYAHRAAYLLANGVLSDGLKVCHSCDNPLCINPRHLFLGTQGDNVRDCKQKGRNNIGSRNGAARFKEADIVKMRELFASGTRQSDLARMFGVRFGTIARIVHRQSWSWM